MIRKSELRNTVELAADVLRDLMVRAPVRSEYDAYRKEVEMLRIDIVIEHLHWLIDVDTTSINDEEERDM